MTRHLRVWLTCCALGMVLPACAADPTRPGAIAPPKRLPEIVAAPATPAGEPVNVAAMPREVRRAVVADAARRFKVPESAVVLTRAEQLTWSDGSLGCPEPGRVYTQMLVPGFRVVAKTSAGELTYHTDALGNAVTCVVIASRPAKKLSDKVSHGSEPVNTPEQEPRPVR
jgi:hypothetical protein